MIKYGFIISLLLIISTLVSFAGDVISPFIISFVLAYLFQPVINYLKKKLHLSRNIAVLLTFFSIVLIVFIISFSVFPLLYKEITQFFLKIPQYQEYFQTKSIFLLTTKIPIINVPILDIVFSTTNNITSNFLFSIKSVINNLWQYTIKTAYLLILIPISLFFFLRDWPKILNTLEQLIPPNNKKIIIKLLTDIDIVLFAYISGQFNICILLAIYYILGLWIIDTNFYVLLGLMSGFSIILPFMGIFFMSSLTILISYIGYGFSIEILYAILLYILGHVLEAYFLTPKIIGRKIGIHPLWIFFILMLWAKFFGLIGVLLAMPSAGIIKVLSHFFIQRYKSNLEK